MVSPICLLIGPRITKPPPPFACYQKLKLTLGVVVSAEGKENKTSNQNRALPSINSRHCKICIGYTYILLMAEIPCMPWVVYEVANCMPIKEHLLSFVTSGKLVYDA